MNQDNVAAAWIAKAKVIGRDHGRNAASWTADGNTREDVSRGVLAMLRDGDYDGAEPFLPRRPDLSGEFADELTPQRLYEQITGEPSDVPVTDAAWPGISALIDELCAAYEDGVSETFHPACESQLIAVTS